MELKRVSFKIAKAVKEAGYPQDYEAFYSNDGELHVNMSYEYKTYMYKNQIGYSAPTYLAVWLWLWREKNIRIHPAYKSVTIMPLGTLLDCSNDPEEAISAAVRYLVDNDLIKQLWQK